VAVRIAGAQGPAALERLRGKGITATSGVTLGGQSFGSSTATGTLAGHSTVASIQPSGGAYVIPVPRASAAMLTLPESPPA
jgi:hypothetical protein